MDAVRHDRAGRIIVSIGIRPRNLSRALLKGSAEIKGGMILVEGRDPIHSVLKIVHSLVAAPSISAACGEDGPSKAPAEEALVKVDNIIAELDDLHARMVPKERIKDDPSIVDGVLNHVLNRAASNELEDAVVPANGEPDPAAVWIV